MSNGWVKLHRRLLASPIFTSEKGLKVWIWCLLKANHEGKSAYLGTKLSMLEPGQFVTGRNKAKDELGFSVGTIWKWLGVLERDEYIERQATNKYTVVTIKNWTTYQETERKLNAKRTQTEPYKNDKNEKNNLNGEPVSYQQTRDAIANGLSFQSKSGITTPWQDKGFRYAEYLGIELKDQSIKGRWLKFFKDNAANGKVDLTVTYLKDYLPFTQLASAEAKMKYFMGYFYNSSKVAIITLFCLFSFVCVSDGVFAATVTRKVQIQPKLTIARPLVKKAPTHKKTDEVTSSDRRESTVAKRETLQASSAAPTQAIPPASASLIEPYKKYLTEDANEVRNKLLPQIYADYDADNALALDNILKKEAGYRPDAINEIGAGGMPQALPYSKMGCDLAWTDEAVQCQYAWIKTYIANRYGSPIEAWQFHVAWGYY